MDQVVIAFTIMPQSAGHVVFKVFKHYPTAELFIKRQSDPAQWMITVQKVET